MFLKISNLDVEAVNINTGNLVPKECLSSDDGSAASALTKFRDLDVYEIKYVSLFTQSISDCTLF